MRLPEKACTGKPHPEIEDLQVTFHSRDLWDASMRLRLSDYTREENRFGDAAGEDAPEVWCKPPCGSSVVRKYDG